MLPNETGAADFENEIGALKMELDAFKGVEITAENAPEVRDVIARAGEMSKRAEARRKDDKQPHLDAGRAVDASYKPVLASIAEIGTAAKAILKPFIIAEQERQRAEAEAARKAAEKAREDAIMSERAAAKEKAAAEPVRISGGTTGARAVSLRTRRFAQITDAAALVVHYADRISVIEAAEKCANAEIRAAKGGAISIPGVTIAEEQEVA
jgi:hypothetical protein